MARKGKKRGQVMRRSQGFGLVGRSGPSTSAAGYLGDEPSVTPGGLMATSPERRGLFGLFRKPLGPREERERRGPFSPGSINARPIFRIPPRPFYEPPRRPPATSERGRVPAFGAVFPRGISLKEMRMERHSFGAPTVSKIAEEEAPCPVVR